VRDLESLARHDARDRQADPSVAQRLNGLLPRIDFFLAGEPRHGHRNRVRRRRHERADRAPAAGRVANISAWNYPWFVGCNVICRRC
jgi:hypothetical protein